MKVRLVFLPCLLLPLLAAPADREQNWTHFVRIGGNSLRMDRVDQIVADATASNVFGIETDNDIPGRYESFLDPAEKLAAIKAVAAKAHAAGNHAFVYIAGLECITADADKKAHTFMKDHPDWVQRRITGEPAVFGGGSAFWIRKGDEDVWISPYAQEWRRIYMERVRQIAATGIDGVYVDIPYWMTHFDGWEDTWASFDDYTVEAFRRETKLDARKDIKLGDFKDPGFRRWVDFRIATLTAFMREIDTNVKSVNRNCMTIAEIYPGIEGEAVRVGADVYDMYPVVDAIAHEYNFASGGGTSAAKTPLDWFGHIAVLQTFRHFAQGRPTWMLTYSWDGEKAVDRRDAMANMFMAQVVAAANVWDARGHVMSGSNDLPTRTRIFGWIKEHSQTFYAPRDPISPVGVYFSPRTRNYFAQEYIDSYKGTLALLMQSHLEFQVVTPATLRSFGGPVLMLPDAKCLSSEEIDGVRSLVSSRRGIAVTGETGRYDETGLPRGSNPIHQMLQLKRPDLKTIGKTPVDFIYDPASPGTAYWRLLTEEFDRVAADGKAAGTRFDETRARYIKELTQATAFRPTVEVSASPFVAALIAKVDGKPSVFLANFKGLKSKANAVQIPERDIKITFPGTSSSRIRMFSFLGTAQDVESHYQNGKVSCVISVLEKAAVVWVEQ